MPNVTTTIMGCTSSAPNMAYPNTAEKSIQFEEINNDDHTKEIEEPIHIAATETDVLPSCDTLAEPVHLSRNKSTSSLQNEIVKFEEDHIIENISKIEPHNLQDDKITRLEEVVEKVVGLHMTDEEDKPLQSVETITDEPPEPVENDTDNLSLKEDNDDHTEEHNDTESDEEKEEIAEESLSPTPSESSRATRWEALADIAAELPPSLTVDPITGQIYTLSK